MTMSEMRSTSEPCDGGIKSVPDLLRQCDARGEREAFQGIVAGMQGSTTRHLLQRVATVEDPLTFWALQLLLDARDIAPCLRLPKRDKSEQLVFLTWLADVAWFVKRNPLHQTFYGRWQGLLRNSRGTEKWHKVAIWVYRAGHQNPSHYHSKGIGLSDMQRQPMMTMLSNASRAHRRILHRLPELGDQILLRCLAYPDRSGRFSAEDVRDRRVKVLQVFMLAGRNKTLAADYYCKLTGDQLSRQALTRHLEAIEIATGLRSLSSG